MEPASSLRIRLLFFGIGVCVVAVLSALVIAAWGLWDGAQTARSTREAVCQILIKSRAAGLAAATSEQQVERIIVVYNDVIGLGEGCEIP